MAFDDNDGEWKDIDGICNRASGVGQDGAMLVWPVGVVGWWSSSTEEMALVLDIVLGLRPKPRIAATYRVKYTLAN